MVTVDMSVVDMQWEEIFDGLSRKIYTGDWHMAAGNLHSYFLSLEFENLQCLVLAHDAIAAASTSLNLRYPRTR